MENNRDATRTAEEKSADIKLHVTHLCFQVDVREDLALQSKIRTVSCFQIGSILQFYRRAINCASGNNAHAKNRNAGDKRLNKSKYFIAAFDTDWESNIILV